MHAIHSLVFALISISTCCAAEDSEVAERAATSMKAAASLQAGDFAELQRQVEIYTNVDRRTSSGAFKIEQFDDGIAQAMKFRGASAESQFKELIAKTEAWTLQYPDAPLSYVLHARALHEYGYFYRGSGYSDTVSPRGAELFEKYSRQAAEVLLKNHKIASIYTGWHATFLNVARSLGAPKALVMQTVEEGIRKNPDDYRLYHYSLVYFLPKWYGTAKDVEDLIAIAEKNTSEKHGLEIYARLYSAAAQEQFRHRLYADSLVSWPKMKRGLEDWNSHFPTEWNMNIFAYHACIARDKVKAKELIEKIANRPILRIWEPDSQLVFSTCQRFVAEP